MIKAIKRNEPKPTNAIYSFEWTVKYREDGLTKTEQYFTLNKGGNAYHAVTRRFHKEHPNVEIINISCD